LFLILKNVFCFSRNFATRFTAGSGVLGALGGHLNRWYSDKIMDQDVELLTGQMVNLLNSAKPWNTVVRADKIAVRYRKWREQAERTNPWLTQNPKHPLPCLRLSLSLFTLRSSDGDVREKVLWLPPIGGS
jgi:hypothetical protein